MREMAKEEMDNSQERLPVLEEEIKICEDDQLNVFDLCMMKRMLIVKINSN